MKKLLLALLMLIAMLPFASAGILSGVDIHYQAVGNGWGHIANGYKNFQVSAPKFTTGHQSDYFGSNTYFTERSSNGLRFNLRTDYPIGHVSYADGSRSVVRGDRQVTQVNVWKTGSFGTYINRNTDGGYSGSGYVGGGLGTPVVRSAPYNWNYNTFNRYHNTHTYGYRPVGHSIATAYSAPRTSYYGGY